MNNDYKIRKYKYKYINSSDNNKKIRYKNKLNEYGYDFNVNSTMKGGNADNTINIIFIRHGESTQNKAMRDDEDYDIENIVLTKIGEEQAKMTGQYIKDVYHIDKIYSSPIKRCVQTSNHIINNMNYDGELIIKEELIEIGEINHDFFSASKEEQEELINRHSDVFELQEELNNNKNQFDKLEKSEMFMDKLSMAFNIEPSYSSASVQYKNVLDELVNDTVKNIIVVCHRGTIENIEKMICGIDVYNQLKISNVTNCSITCIQYDKINDKFKLVSKASDSHIENSTE